MRPPVCPTVVTLVVVVTALAIGTQARLARRTSVSDDCFSAVDSIEAQLPTAPAALQSWDLTATPAPNGCLLTVPPSLSPLWASLTSSWLSWYTVQSANLAALNDDCPGYGIDNIILCAAQMELPTVTTTLEISPETTTGLTRETGSSTYTYATEVGSQPTTSPGAAGEGGGVAVAVLSPGAKAGIAVGVAVPAIATLITVFLCLRRRKQAARKAANDDDDDNNNNNSNSGRRRRAELHSEHITEPVELYASVTGPLMAEVPVAASLTPDETAGGDGPRWKDGGYTSPVMAKLRQLGQTSATEIPTTEIPVERSNPTSPQPESQPLVTARMPPTLSTEPSAGELEQLLRHEQEQAEQRLPPRVSPSPHASTLPYDTATMATTRSPGLSAAMSPAISDVHEPSGDELEQLLRHERELETRRMTLVELKTVQDEQVAVRQRIHALKQARGA